MYEGWAIRAGPCTETFNDVLCVSFVSWANADLILTRLFGVDLNSM
jgi:hypothetical protein